MQLCTSPSPFPLCHTLSLFHSAQLVQQCADIYGTKCRRQLADKCLETVMACHGIQCQHATRHGIPACPEAEHSKSVCHLLTFPMSASTLALCPRSCRRICSDTASALLPLPFFVAYFCVPALKSPLPGLTSTSTWLKCALHAAYDAARLLCRCSSTLLLIFITQV